MVIGEKLLEISVVILLASAQISQARYKLRPSSEKSQTSQCQKSSHENQLKLLLNEINSLKEELGVKFDQLTEKYQCTGQDGGLQPPAALRQPSCSKTIQALDTLVEKIIIEVKIFEDESKKNNFYNATTTAESLGKLNTFISRSEFFISELALEPVNDCSSQVRNKHENITYTINRLENKFKERARRHRVVESVKAIRNGTYTDTIKSLASLEPLELDQTLIGIVSDLLPDINTNIPIIMNQIFPFIRQVGPTSSQLVKTMLELVIDKVKVKPGPDSPFLLVLAHESKLLLDDQLKEKFPMGIQILIWETTACIRNKENGLYLLETKEQGQVQRENSGDYDGDTLGLIVDPRPRNIVTRMPLEATHTEPAESCSWEIHPVVGSASSTSPSLKFIFRKKIESDWKWNLDGDVVKISIKHADLTPDFSWDILPMANGTEFSLRNSINITSAFAHEPQQYSLCSEKKQERDPHLSGVWLTSYSSFNKLCNWVLEIPNPIIPLPRANELEFI